MSFLPKINYYLSYWDGNEPPVVIYGMFPDIYDWNETPLVRSVRLCSQPMSTSPEITGRDKKNNAKVGHKQI